ncbi:nuclear transport factor 2 family protein [Zavarzinia compransoris]|uniref:nuclear transport factor 2 family protein n=1 Tax=Zavarzinia marina TaxID=2911065 RepID=UPI001F4543C7|nr:nuclear transport factor 2 family protein [Zavarzinia marina]MCF4166203.1 nuclear transport factor 2 family protein [Zavarzinia marina]
MLREALVGMLGAVSGPLDKAGAEDLLRRYLVTFETKDVAARSALFAADTVVEDPVGLPAHVGLEAVQAFWAQGDQGPAQFTSELHRVVYCGSDFLAHFTVHMRMPGMGEIAIEVFSTYAVDGDGKIARMRAFWDESCLT